MKELEVGDLTEVTYPKLPFTLEAVGSSWRMRKPHIFFLGLVSVGTVLSQFIYKETATDILRRERLSQARLLWETSHENNTPARLL